MGNLWIALKALFEKLGHEVIPPPPVTRNTIELGVRYAPEFACLPLKVNVGNFIEGLEKGAETVVMLGGSGPCRFGYYAQVEREILKDLGYSFNIIVVDPPMGDWQRFLQDLQPLGNGCGWREVWDALTLAWEKIKALDQIHRTLLKVQFYNPRVTWKCYDHAVKAINGVDDKKLLQRATSEGIRKLALFSENQNGTFAPLKIVIVGEVFMMWEPYVNLDLEKALGGMGVEVIRSAYLSDWICDNVLFNPRHMLRRIKFKKAAKPYLNCFIGGHGWESVGESVLYARKKIDGIIHVLPFTCMPEIVAQSILPAVSRDYHLPVLTLSLDEHSAQAGFLTRIEAFVDLIRERKQITA
jgi:predicted nucleotide-binding protein (sugar kinase/HSP70/actin superfamily)